MEKDCMVKLTKGQVEQLMELLDDYLEYEWDGYGTMRGTWNRIFHRMKADDDSIPLYAVAYDNESKKHVVFNLATIIFGNLKIDVDKQETACYHVANKETRRCLDDRCFNAERRC